MVNMMEILKSLLINKFLLFILIFCHFNLAFSNTEFTDEEKKLLSSPTDPFKYSTLIPIQKKNELLDKFLMMINETYHSVKNNPAWLKAFPDKERLDGEIFNAMLLQLFKPDDDGWKANDIYTLDAALMLIDFSKSKVIDEYQSLIEAKFFENVNNIFMQNIERTSSSVDQVELITSFTLWLQKIEDKEIAFQILNAITSLAFKYLNDSNLDFLVTMNSNLVVMNSNTQFINELQVNYINAFKNSYKHNTKYAEMFKKSERELEEIIANKKELFKGSDWYQVIKIQEKVRELVLARDNRSDKIFDITSELKSLSSNFLTSLEKKNVSDDEIKFLSRTYEFVIDSALNEYYLNSGNLKKSNELDLKILSYINEFIDGLEKTINQNSIYLGANDPEIFGHIVKWLSYSSISGNHERLLKLNKRLLEIVSKSDEIGFKKAKAIILESMAMQHDRIGEIEISTKLRDEARLIAFEIDEYSIEQASFQTTYNLVQGNLAPAYYFSDLTFQRCIENVGKDNLNTCHVYTKISKMILDEALALHPELDTNKIYQKKPLDISGILFELNPKISPTRGNEIYKETMKVYMDAYNLQLISQLGSANHIQQLQSIEFLITLYAQFPEELKDHKVWLGYLSKIYINLFIDHLNDVKLVNYNDSENLLKSSDFILRNIVNIFYETENYDSLEIVFKLIKEKDFYEFVQRKHEVKISKIDFTKNEEIFSQKLMILKKDIQMLTELQKKEVGNANYIEMLKVKKNKFHELVELLNKMENDNQIEKVLKNIKLTSDDVLLEYIVNQNDLLLFVTKFDGSIKKFQLSNNFRDLRLKILKLNALIEKKEKIDNKLISELSALLLPENLIIFDDNVKNIKLVTDDILNLIPFDIFNYKNERIINKFSIAELISSTEVEVFSESNNLNIFYAENAFSNDEISFSALPSVKDEANFIEKYSKDKFKNIQIFPNKLFDQKRLINSLKKDGDNIHISTHVKANGASYGNVYMMLGNESVIDLKSLDVYLTKSNLNMIVLSACDTADLSMDIQTKVYSGMSTFFHKKGTKNVISTLWSIDDKATSYFMALLYDIYSNNDTEWSEAIRHTKNFFSNKGKIDNQINFTIDEKTINQIKEYSHPYYWAPFQLSTIN